MTDFKEELEKILIDYSATFISKEKAVERLENLFKQYIADKEPEKKHTGNDQNVYITSENEQYNLAIQEYRQALEEGLTKEDNSPTLNDTIQKEKGLEEW